MIEVVLEYIHTPLGGFLFGLTSSAVALVGVWKWQAVCKDRKNKYLKGRWG